MKKQSESEIQKTIFLAVLTGEGTGLKQKDIEPEILDLLTAKGNNGLMQEDFDNMSLSEIDRILEVINISIFNSEKHLERWKRYKDSSVKIKEMLDRVELKLEVKNDFIAKFVFQKMKKIHINISNSKLEAFTKAELLKIEKERCKAKNQTRTSSKIERQLIVAVPIIVATVLTITYIYYRDKDNIFWNKYYPILIIASLIALIISIFPKYINNNSLIFQESPKKMFLFFIFVFSSFFLLLSDSTLRLIEFINKL